MNEFKYLTNSSEEEILNTWSALGEAVATKNTKFYAKGSVIKIDCSNGDGRSSAPLHNKIIYVLENYKVDNKINYCINWEDLSADDVDGLHVAVEGIQLPFFGVLPAHWNATFTPDASFLPYSDKEKATIDTGGVTISDLELETILTVIGLPFVVFEDVEYSKEQIIKYMIRPAMQRYFTFRPIIKEEGIGNLARGAAFCLPFPKNAYKAIPYYVTGAGTGAGSESASGLMSPWYMYGEQHMGGGGYSKFAGNITYRNKQVPGYTGLSGGYAQSAMLDNLAAKQGYINFFRREHYCQEKIDGVLYAKGFSSTGGMLNMKWLCTSYDADDIKFEDLEPIWRRMARIEVCRNFHIVRSLVKTDIAGSLDPAIFKEYHDKFEQDLTPIINSIGTVGSLAIERGGA